MVRASFSCRPTPAPCPACASSDPATKPDARSVKRTLETGMSALGLAIAAIVAWIVIGALGMVRPRNLAFVSHGLFPAGSAVGLALAIVGWSAIGVVPQSTVLPLGLP